MSLNPNTVNQSFEAPGYKPHFWIKHHFGCVFILVARLIKAELLQSVEIHCDLLCHSLVLQFVLESMHSWHFALTFGIIFWQLSTIFHRSVLMGSPPNIRLQCPGFESDWGWNSAHDCMALNPCPAEPGYTLFCKQCRSRSVGFWRSQLIWICTVGHQVCKFIATIWIK